MARVKTGGDPEEYMQAPSLGGAGGTDTGEGPSFIASILDLLGIHRQVAKGEKAVKEDKAVAPQGKAADAIPANADPGSQPGSNAGAAQNAIPPDQVIPVAQSGGLEALLQDFDSTFGNPSRSADLNNSLIPIDPDFMFPKFKK